MPARNFFCKLVLFEQYEYLVAFFSFLLQRSKKEKNASLHSVAWFPWEKMHSDEKIVGAGVWPSLFLSQIDFGFFP